MTDDEKQLFREAMTSVKPLGKRSKAPDDMPPPSIRYQEAKQSTDCDYLDSSYEEDVNPDTKLAYFNQTMRPLDQRQLLQGKKRLEGTLDLHGKTVNEARAELSDFLSEAHRDGLKCVRIIHGKGRISGRALLKTKVNAWLPQSRYVIAFCSCIPKHGGTGAVYVLLRS